MAGRWPLPVTDRKRGCEADRPSPETKTSTVRDNMKRITYKALFGMILLAALVAAPSTGFLPARAAAPVHAPSSANRSLIGTWEVQVSIRDCVSQQVVRTFPSLLTFGAHGTLIETTAGVSPAARGPGHGDWQAIGNNAYSAVFKAFRYDSNGDWIGGQTVRQVITLETTGIWTANASVELTNIEGNIIGTGCATAIGLRLE
jgi:hypothetical protein